MPVPLAIRCRLLPVVAALVALAALVPAVACGDDGSTSGAGGAFEPREPGVLTVATDLPAAGFWDGDDPDDLSGGFEYELAQRLADDLGLDDVRVLDIPFEEIVTGEARGYDVALAQISITPERREVLDFSEPYLTTPVGAVGAEGGEEPLAPDLAAARDLRWGVVESTTEVDVVDDLVRPRDQPARVYGTAEAALAGVRAGEVDVVALDYARALGEVSAADGLVLVAQITAPQSYGVALPPGSGNRAAVDSAIRGFKADGTLPDLTEQLYETFDDGVDRDVPTLRVAG